MLALAASITGDAEEKRQAKVERAVRRFFLFTHALWFLADFDLSLQLGNPVKNAPAPKNPAQAAKQKQLVRFLLFSPLPPASFYDLSVFIFNPSHPQDAARAIVAARTKAKKDKQKADAAPKPAAAPLAKGKKRVSFA